MSQDVTSPTASAAAHGGKGFPPSLLSSFVWGIAAFFYLAAFYLRTQPAVMTTELMRDFGMNASQLGVLAAFFFYAYVAMQIPTGVLVDSWGARRLLVAGSIMAAVGSILFGATTSFGLAALARAITGAATAVGWVVTLKLATHWFPSKRFATLSGLGLFIGNLGALVAQVPLRLLVDSFGWRSVSIVSGAVMAGVAVLAWTGIRDDPSERGYDTYAPKTAQSASHVPVLQLLKGFKEVFRYRNTWLIFLAQGSFVGSILSFTGLWGAPFLKARFGVSGTTAAGVCSVMIVSWAVASLTCGYLSDRTGQRKPVYLTGAVVAAAGWSVLFYMPGLSLSVFVVIAAVTSFACGAVVLGFAYGKESVPARYLGTISGAINVGNMIGPTLLQPGIGWVLDRQWAGQTVNGLRVYDVSAFQTAFLLVIVWSLVGSVLIALTTDTHCKQSA
ncbi:MAG: MFS transporter [Acidobacteria bacterium]|nr:MFS transporter [Acidobacteriota bacterium]